MTQLFSFLSDSDLTSFSNGLISFENLRDTECQWCKEEKPEEGDPLPATCFFEDKPLCRLCAEYMLFRTFARENGYTIHNWINDFNTKTCNGCFGESLFIYTNSEESEYCSECLARTLVGTLIKPVR